MAGQGSGSWKSCEVFIGAHLAGNGSISATAVAFTGPVVQQIERTKRWAESCALILFNPLGKWRETETAHMHTLASRELFFSTSAFFIVILESGRFLVPKMKTAGAHSNGKPHLGVPGLLGGVYLGKTPVPKMKNGRNPIPLKNTRGVLGLLGGGQWGEISGYPMKNGRGPLYTKKGEERKNKRREGIRKTLASSKILTHGLGSLKGSPQFEKKKKKKKALRSDNPAVWTWSPASYQLKSKSKWSPWWKKPLFK